MGKVRRKRTSLHLSAKTKNTSSILKTQQIPHVEHAIHPLSENPFSGIEISQSLLSQSLRESGRICSDAANTSVYPESLEELKNPGKNTHPKHQVDQRHLSKKEKQKRKREEFLAKLEATKQVKKKVAAAKKRAAVPIVGDLKPMSLALSDIDRIISGGEINNEPSAVVNKKKSRPKRRKPRRLKGQNNERDPLEQYRTISDNSIKKIRSKATQKHMLYEIKRFRKYIDSSSLSKSIVVPKTEKV